MRRDFNGGSRYHRPRPAFLVQKCSKRSRDGRIERLGCRFPGRLRITRDTIRTRSSHYRGLEALSAFQDIGIATHGREAVCYRHAGGLAPHVAFLVFATRRCGRLSADFRVACRNPPTGLDTDPKQTERRFEKVHDSLMLRIQAFANEMS